MKRWSMHYRNFIIICVLIVSFAALILVALGPHHLPDKLPVQAAVTPSPTNQTVATPPTNNDTADIDLFKLVQEDKYLYFRVNENNQVWDYKPGQPIWYSQTDARFMLAIDVPYPNRITPKQLEILRNNIAITTTTGEPVSFTIMEGDSEQQLIISLKGTPNSDLTLTFFSADQSQIKPFIIYYMKPFDYKIISDRIPLLDKAFVFSKENIVLPLSVQTHASHVLLFQFTDEVDRASVDEHFKAILTNVNWSVDWVDNRTFNLVLNFDHKLEESYLKLSASGIRNARGVELKSTNYIVIEPTDTKGYGSYDLSTNTIAAWFNTNRQYDEIMPSSNDNWLLASTVLKKAAQSQHLYEILDEQGNVVKQFDFNSLVSPHWLNDEAGLLYINGRANSRELVLYDLDTDSTKLIWQTPDASSQILGFAIEPKSGVIAVAWGKSNSLEIYELHMEILRNIRDSSPKRYPIIGKLACNDTPCSYPLEWLNDNYLIYPTNDGRQILNIKLEQSRLFAKTLVQTKYSLFGIIPYRSKNWAVAMSKEKDHQQWIWSDGEQDITFTTELVIPDQEQLLKGLYGNGSTALFYVHNMGWYKIDPSARTTQLTNDVISSLQPELIIGQHKGKLIIGLE
ncbi:hypothetical protein E0485_18420 [Paenibacillus albiflavus]|uniref:Uncharacterized protein n=1 Tax=Paenibacillus albiflavus TaxID=2545760 RepID=A0A4R4EB66_9BACL|nr:hypothetical protein [Paenibacillus albiflavus]TCZ75125.1 hypothetical protein E0485_18420 [Paenibacillus albiflavus]